MSGVQFGLKFIRVISKSNERADQNCTTWSSIASLSNSFWNCTILDFGVFFSLSIWKRMSCDENSFERKKPKSSSEVRTKTVYFMHQVLVAVINDGRRSFLLWLRLRLLVNFLWRRNLGRSAAGAILWWIWVVKLPRDYDAQRIDSSVVLCMILRDSSSLVSPFLFMTSA